MAKALEGVNWQTIAVGYATGKTSVELSQEHGVPENTIRQRARRYKWSLKALREAETNQNALNESSVGSQTKRVVDLPRAKNALSLTCHALQAQSAFNVLEESKKRFLESGAAMAQTVFDKGKDAMQGVDYEQAARIAAQAEGALKIGKAVFGLGDGTQVQVGLQVNILSELPEEREDAIDV